MSNSQCRRKFVFERTPMTRHEAQIRSIEVNGRPIGVCLHWCSKCGNILRHVGLSHWCSDCKRFVALDAPCDDVWTDHEARIEEMFS